MSYSSWLKPQHKIRQTIFLVWMFILLYIIQYIILNNALHCNALQWNIKTKFELFCMTFKQRVYLAFSFNKQYYTIEIQLSSIYQSTVQYFSVLPSCWSDTENQLYQYWSPRKVNAGFVIENVCILTRVRKYNET